MRALVFTTILAAAVGMAARAPGAPLDCRSTPYTSSRCVGLPNPHCRTLPAAACFEVAGVLGFGVGTPSIRLSPSGSHRILGVFGGDGDPEAAGIVPRNVDRLRQGPPDDYVQSVRGRFRVCPLKTDRPGWMRPVCIAAARDLVVAQKVHLERSRRPSAR